MPPSKVADDVLLEKIGDVFRAYGYEGASIRLLSEATGLERASLYHRFPGGKEEMAVAIIARTSAWFEKNVFAPLASAGTPAGKLERVARNLRDLYRSGRSSCVLDSMTLGGGPQTVRDSVRRMYLAWLDAFAKVARSAGMPAPIARSRAQQALIEIEGSLVVARVTGDSKPFLEVLKKLPGMLGAAGARETQT